MNERTDDLCGVELAQAIEQLICLAKAGNAPAIITLLDEKSHPRRSNPQHPAAAFQYD